MDKEDIIFWQYIISFALLVLMKIVCFFLGYLTIRLGYLLIASGAKGEFKFSASYGTFKGNLVSVSPGLLFVLLGILLIGYALFVDKAVDMEYEQFNGVNRHDREFLDHEKPDPPLPDSFELQNREDISNAEADISSKETVQDVEPNAFSVGDSENVEASTKNEKE